MGQGSNNLLSTLSLSELEILVQTIVQRVVKAELKNTQVELISSDRELLSTFGCWEDDRSPETIIHEIYQGRTLAFPEL